MQERVWQQVATIQLGLIHNLSHCAVLSHSVVSNSSRPMNCSPLSIGILQARILEWVAILLHGIFPTQESNPGFPHYRRILYHLSHQGSPMGNYIPIIVMSKGDFEHRHQQNQIPYTDSLRLVLPQVREIENQPGYCCSPLHPLPSSLCPPPSVAHQNIGKRTVLIVHTYFP